MDLPDILETFVLLCLEKADNSVDESSLAIFHSLVDDSNYIFADNVLSYIVDSDASKSLYAKCGGSLYKIARESEIIYTLGVMAFSDNAAKEKLYVTNSEFPLYIS